MLDTANVLLESAGNFTSEFSLVALGENATEFDSLKSINAEMRDQLTFREASVAVHETKGKNYLIEYSHNLERFMEDQNITINEALDRVINSNDIPSERVYVVIEQSDVSKLNIKAAQSMGIKIVKK